MPPHGLYRVSRHHLYGGTPRRPVYNARDFADSAADDDDNIVTAMAPPRPIFNAKDFEDAGANDDTAVGDTAPLSLGDATAESNMTDKEKKAKKKIKKGQRSDGQTGRTTASKQVKPTAVEDASLLRIGTSPNTKVKRTKEDAKGDAVGSIIKKRKRESDVNLTADTALPETLGGGKTASFVVGADLVKNLENSMAGMGTQFTQNVREREKATKKSKKKEKSVRKSAVHLAKNNNVLMQHTQSALDNKIKLPVKTHGSPQKKPKKTKSNAGNNEGKEMSQQTGTPPPKKTPVPLPEPLKFSAFNAKLEAAGNGAVEDFDVPEILVPETSSPLALRAGRAGFKSPVPLPPSLVMKFHPFKGMNEDDSSQSFDITKPLDILQPPSSAPAPSVLHSHKMNQRTLAATQPTSALTKKITQPLSDRPKPKPKPRPRASRASSLSSSSSKTSSVSIVDMFNRVPKPNARSGAASIDPFVTVEPKKAKPRETQDEAPMNIFNDIFNAVQKSVDFAVEHEYLDLYLDWHADNETGYPLPCLGRGSGCTPAKEEKLRQSRKAVVSVDKAIATSGGNASALQEADQRTQQAVEFLKLAIRARVPVPIGHLEGVWTLYCPSYSANHFDRYGYGARTMTISSIAGFYGKNAYTARLSIPPRSMTYSILTFAVPPHASFRTTIIKTAQEGYTMDIIFLGNGFLRLRVDLNLLLKGKPTEQVGGKKAWMEFVGVHERAVEWVDRKDEHEEEHRKLFAKYEGVNDG